MSRTLHKILFAIRTNSFFQCNREATILASGRVDAPQRGSTGNTAAFPEGVRRSTMFAGNSSQPFRKSVRGTKCRDSSVNHSPHVFNELDILEILGDIVQPAKQAKGIAKC
jgi:hypothetical protein